MSDKRRAKVLVVDDDPIVLRAVSEILTREGYTVVGVDDAVEGLTAARDPSIDVCILDIKMPHLSGMDLLKAIKHERPGLEVIMMTAFATVETAVQAVKAFTEGFAELNDATVTPAQWQSVVDYYNRTFSDRLDGDNAVAPISSVSTS